MRKALGVRTFFNMLGHLVNPVMPKYQLLGVYNLKLLRLYDYIARQQGVNCTVVHSLDGYDEISLTSPFKVACADGERLMDASMLGLSSVRPSDLSGGNSVEEASAIFDRVLAGKGSKSQTDCVIANATFALKTLEPELSLEEAISIARESLESGKALEAFRKFVNVNS